MKKVCVIMSTYKSDNSSYLKLAIDSVLAQDYPCDLYLYCDGELSIALNNIVEEYVSYKNVFIVRNNVNNGLAFSLNSLIDLVILKDYDFIARMDGDDISRVNRLSRQVSYFIDNPNVSVCGTFCSEFGSSYSLSEKKLPTAHSDLLTFSISRCPFIHPTVMFRASVFQSGCRYPTDTYFTEDMSLWFLLLDKGMQFGNVPEVLLDYRLNENTIERRMGLKKSIAETKLRFRYMVILKQVSLINLFYIISRFFFHLLPSSFVKILYRYCR